MCNVPHLKLAGGDDMSRILNTLLLGMSLIYFTGCGKSGVPIVDFSNTHNVDPVQYEEMLEKNLERSLNSNPNQVSDSEELYLRHIVVGFSFDVRFGLWSWRKGVSSGIEMHLNAPEVPYAN